MRPLLLLGLLLLPTAVLAQTPPPSCEAQVQEQARQLTTDGLLPAATAPQWGPQLTAIATQLRTLRHQYDIKKSQAELAEQNVAALLEQLRQAQQQLRTLRDGEAKGPPPATSN